MEIHLLDVGTREYGDCIIVHNDQKKILIDGAHQGDSALLKKQMKAIFKHNAPYHFDLLVMTHLHSDHIGCLPELIKNGDITAAKSLLMDPKFRWNEGANHTILGNDALVDALLEEDHSFLPDDELQQFLIDSGFLVDRYNDMITKLKQSSKVILFNGVDAKDYKPLENEFKSLGLKILGPTKKHLQLTKDALDSQIDALTDFVSSPSFTDAATNDVDRYRKLYSRGITDSAPAIDAIQNKGSINDESIVLKFKSKAPNSWTAFLAGDMQFAIPEVSGLDDEMKKLLKKANDNGPYDFIKTSHHTSYNGIDEEMLDHWIDQGTEFYAHSGGLYDPSHPEPDMLDSLKQRKDKLQFVRTDRNGLIRVANDENGEVSLWITKGEVNTFTKNKNKPRDDDAGVSKEEGTKNILFNKADGSQIQFAAVLPENRSVKITIEVDGEKKN